MQLLTAVNLVLPKLGERAVTSLDTRHPTLAVLLPIIDQTQRNVLRRGWWFNEFDYKAYPSVVGEIDIGSTTLSFIPRYADTAVVRGTRLYNPETLSYVFTDYVEGKVIQNIEFDELPDSAASYIFYASLVEAYATDLGVTQELSVWQTMAGMAWSDMLAEHLRQRKHSTRKSTRWARLTNALRG